MVAQIENDGGNMNDDKHKQLRAMYLGESIAAGVCDSLEDMGVTTMEASQLIEEAEGEYWIDSVYQGLQDYIKKLKLNGGKPKPCQVSFTII